MALYRDAAIVLRTQKLGEADRIVTLLTRQHGKVRAVAKGVRRTRSRFGARLEPFMVVDVMLYEGRSLDTVTQAETLAPYGDPIARDYVAYTAATAMLETAERLTEEREPVGATVPPACRRAELTCGWGARGGPGPGLLPAAVAGRRGLGTELPRLRTVWRQGTPARVQPRQRRHSLPVLPDTRLGVPVTGHPRAAGGPARRRLERRRREPAPAST